MNNIFLREFMAGISNTMAAPSFFDLRYGSDEEEPVKEPPADYKKESDAGKEESITSRTKRIFYDRNVPTKDDILLLSHVKNSIGVNSLDDVAASLKLNRKLCDVIIASGHGAPSHQGLGSGIKVQYTKGKDICYGCLGDIEKPLKVVQDYMLPQEDHPSPVLFLAGCEVGKGKALLLKELSSMLKGVCVAASSDIMSIEEVETEEDEPFQVVFQRLAPNHKPTPTFLPEIVYALNGEKVALEKLTSLTGHDPDELRADLLLHGDD